MLLLTLQQLKSELENDGHAYLIKLGRNNDGGRLEKLIIHFAWPNHPRR